jgi:hypothetical protein
MRRLVPRKFERKQFIGEATVRPLSEGAPLGARVLNLGQSGVALFTRRSLPTGQLVEVTFRVGRTAIQVGIDKRDGRVIRGLSLADGNILGIAFARPLKADELAILEANWVRS